MYHGGGVEVACGIVDLWNVVLVQLAGLARRLGRELPISL